MVKFGNRILLNQTQTLESIEDSAVICKLYFFNEEYQQERTKRMTCAFLLSTHEGSDTSANQQNNHVGLLFYFTQTQSLLICCKIVSLKNHTYFPALRFRIFLSKFYKSQRSMQARAHLLETFVPYSGQINHTTATPCRSYWV